MSQDEVNDQFRSMMFADVINETDEVIRQIVTSEAQARHAMACDQDPLAAQQFANAGYEVLANSSMKMLPSVVMGMADLFNREHEAYTAALDYISDAKEHVRQFQVFWERGDTAMALSSIAAVQSILDHALESALYEKEEEGL